VVSAVLRSSRFNVLLPAKGAQSETDKEALFKQFQAWQADQAAKAAKAKPNKRRRYDDTLPPEREEDLELRDFFSEMKKREF